MTIKVENTAITNGVAKSIKDHLSYIGNSVLDYGTGKMRNALFLLDEGYNVSILDTQEQIKRLPVETKERAKKVYVQGEPIEEKFDTIFCTFVLNVIPSVEIREEVVRHIQNLLQDDGVAIFEVRRTKGIMASKFKEPYLDGYIVGNGNTRTFQKGYEGTELEDVIKPYLHIEKTKKGSDSLILIARRKV